MTSPAPRLNWFQLRIAAPLKDEQVRAALTALAGLAGQPRIVLEAQGHDGRVSWRVAAAQRDVDKVVNALGAHLPNLRTEPLSSTFDGLDRASLSARVRFAGERTSPLKHNASGPVVRGLLAALSRARSHESVDVQLVLGPRRRPRRVAQTRRGEGAAVRRQAAEHSFGCLVRVAGSATDPARSRALINGVVAALRGLEAPGIRLQIQRSSARGFSRARSPLLWPTWLSISDLSPLTGWPAGELPLPGIPDPHPILLSPTSATPTRGRPLGHAIEDSERPVALTEGDALRHLHVIGQTGTGKSELLAQLFLHDVAVGKGAVLIDPQHGLVERVLERIPEHRLDDVVVVDPLDDVVVGVNGLHAGGGDAERSAETLLATLHALYSDTWGIRSSDVAHAALLALARHGEASLAMVPLLLTNAGFRRSVIGRSVRQDPLGAGAFWGWLESLSPAEYQQVTQPLLTKLRPLTTRRGLRAVFGQRHPKFEIADVFAKQKILIVPLGRGRLGSDAAQLLGALMVSLVWDAALSHETAGANTPVSMVIDEVSQFLKLPGGDLGDALAMARSAGLQLTLAHQAMSQLDLATRDGVLANARSRVMFQVSAKDARELAGTSKGQVDPEDLTSLRAFTAYADLLVGNAPSPWVSLATAPLGPKLRTAESVRRRSRERYGQPLSVVEEDLLSLTDLETARPKGEPIGRTRRALHSDVEGGQS